jgi:hypothetical protein
MRVEPAPPAFRFCTLAPIALPATFLGLMALLLTLHALNVGPQELFGEIFVLGAMLGLTFIVPGQAVTMIIVWWTLWSRRSERTAGALIAALIGTLVLVPVLLLH